MSVLLARIKQKNESMMREGAKCAFPGCKELRSTKLTNHHLDFQGYDYVSYDKSPRDPFDAKLTIPLCVECQNKTHQITARMVYLLTHLRDNCAPQKALGELVSYSEEEFCFCLEKQKGIFVIEDNEIKLTGLGKILQTRILNFTRFANVSALSI